MKRVHCKRSGILPECLYSRVLSYLGQNPCAQIHLLSERGSSFPRGPQATSTNNTGLSSVGLHVTSCGCSGLSCAGLQTTSCGSSGLRGPDFPTASSGCSGLRSAGLQTMSHGSSGLCGVGLHTASSGNVGWSSTGLRTVSSGGSGVGGTRLRAANFGSRGLSGTCGGERGRGDGGVRAFFLSCFFFFRSVHNFWCASPGFAQWQSPLALLAWAGLY